MAKHGKWQRKRMLNLFEPTEFPCKPHSSRGNWFTAEWIMTEAMREQINNEISNKKNQAIQERSTMTSSKLYLECFLSK